jgi:hypothetical protein
MLRDLSKQAQQRRAIEVMHTSKDTKQGDTGGGTR